MSAQELERGVSLALATHRAETISNVEYDLKFTLGRSGPIPASVTVRFDLSDASRSVVLDFNSPNATDIRSELTIDNGHVIMPVETLAVGRNEVTIPFVAGDQSLNRNDDFLYTLLVPDRASTVFPCFDQPDLKAKFKLELELPDGWTACANGAIESQTGNTISFRQTKPISTYLFAFAAGEFQSVTRTISGRPVTMYHRESDQEKFERNVDAIFTMHEIALDWMEDYTQIEYPFEKFDFVVIPSFQYGGMEHIGSIFYNADQMFLDETATKKQKLRRASLIAHETAHMWFGNLVTMKWFDDVWLKEVFANFMAAKIVHPSFTDINHDLGFMIRHHPSAYSEDRTGGTYPIQQKLGNLRNAGTLYGRIIYEKAPIVMRQLEAMIGQKEMRNGLREYLNKFRYDNAVWDDLIEILDRDSELDLKQWSDSWVKESGTPELASEAGEDANRRFLTIRQTKKTPQDGFWAQQVDVKVLKDGEVVFETRAMIEGESTEISLPESAGDYDFFLVNGSELGYGYFRLDAKSKSWLLQNIHTISDEVTRGAAWITLYESLIRGIETQEISPVEYMTALLSGIKNESEPLNRQNILSQTQTVFWKLLSSEQRVQFAPSLESALWTLIDNEDAEKDARSAWYKSLVGVATTGHTVDRLYDIWKNESDVAGIPLSESDYMTLAYELAIRMPQKSDEILATQLERLENEDRKKRFAFVMPALSPDVAKRDAFFETLKDVANRRPERWALEALDYLHHPLRAAESEKYILPSLELLEEIQTTGDIFFPKRWLVSTLGGHQSKSSAAIVQKFLADRPDYSVRLKRKILQAADLLLRLRQSQKNPANRNARGVFDG
ncbi:M1 family metallopeptidase [Mariniblastus fucicola]|nr:M1 family aminopeptidase [Mariniblastus fucicola]